jgi:hypothetical protein
VAEGTGGREMAAAVGGIRPLLHAPPCATPAVVHRLRKSEGGRERVAVGSGGRIWRPREGEGGGGIRGLREGEGGSGIRVAAVEKRGRE